MVSIIILCTSLCHCIVCICACMYDNIHWHIGLHQQMNRIPLKFFVEQLGDQKRIVFTGELFISQNKDYSHTRSA